MEEAESFRRQYATCGLNTRGEVHVLSAGFASVGSIVVSVSIKRPTIVMALALAMGEGDQTHSGGLTRDLRRQVARGLLLVLGWANAVVAVN